MIGVLRERVRAQGPALSSLLLSDALNWLALMVGAVATPWWIASHGGAAHLAIYGFVASAMAFVAMPALSPLGDRHPKRRLIMAGLALYALSAALLALWASLDRYWLGGALLAAALNAVAAALMTPAAQTMAAELVPAERLPQALGLQRSAQSAGRVLGPALGGAVLALSTGLTLWLQALLLLAAVLLARRLPTLAGSGGARGLSSWRRDLHAGLRAAWAMPLERGWTLVNFVSVLFMNPAFGMLVPLKIKALGLSGAWLGAAETGLSLGMLAGALGGSAWVARHLGRYATRVGATVAQGLGLALAGWTGQGAVLVLALFFVGLANSCGVLVGQTHRMLATPQHFRARLSSVNMMTIYVAAAAGPALAGTALLHWQIDTVYLVFGLLSMLSALGFFLVPDFKTLMSLDHEQVKDWYARRHPELFAQS